MSWATTIARVLATILGTPGVENVYEVPLAGADTSRSVQELARSVADGRLIQSWEVIFTSAPHHAGASGYLETKMQVEVVAHWVHAAASESLVAFRAKLLEVQERLLDPLVGIPQITEDGIVPVESPDRPVRLPSGQSSWKARFRFETWDVSST